MKHKYLKNVTTLTIHTEKCTGCGMCMQVCPHGVFTIDDVKAQKENKAHRENKAHKENKAAIQQKDLCIECGACASNCQAGALKVNAGVGCALAIIIGWLTRSEPNCDCAGGGCCSD